MVSVQYNGWLLAASVSWLSLCFQAQQNFVCAQQQLYDDPSSYFGGSGNEAYLEWYQTAISENYDSSVYLPSTKDPLQGMAVHWRVIDDKELVLAVAARSSGWIGFGIGDAGGMLGADMALFTASRPTELVDAYTIEERFPQTDTCSSDWELLGSDGTGDENDGFLMFEARRLLDTGDPQDHAILLDPTAPATRIIGAWGDSAEVSYHGDQNVRGTIRFGDTGANGDAETLFHEAMAEQSDGSFELRATDYQIRAVDTDYAGFCLTYQDILAQGVPKSEDEVINIIGFEPIVTPGSEPYVHHFVVTASPNGSSNACSGAMDSGFLDYNAYVWAPGEGSFLLPSNVGLPFSGSDGIKAFHIQIHYDNKARQPTDQIDASGVRMYFTRQSREHELGIIQLGDPNINLYGNRIGEGLSRHSFDCPSSCSNVFLPEPVTVIREFLHMHATGTRMTNEQVRGDNVVRSAAIEVFEFDQNGNQAAMQGEYTFQPGDGYRTTCYFREPQGQEGQVRFGLSSQEEMCMAFVLYYPRMTIPFQDFDVPWFCGYGFNSPGGICDAVYDEEVLGSEEQLSRAFGSSLSVCPSENDEIIESDDGSHAGEEDDNDDDGDGDEDGSGAFTTKSSSTVLFMVGAVSLNFLGSLY